MKVYRMTIVLILLLLSAFVIYGCGGDGGSDVIIDDSGNVKPGPSGATNITFWGWGDREEVTVFSKIVDSFNEKYDGLIKVNYVQKPSNNYGTAMLTSLAGSKTPDVFYVKDNYFKQYASLNYLYDISDFYDNSTVLKDEEMFPYTVSRYRYNTMTTTSNADDPLYGLPKDLAPTAIYYNKTHFAKAGVTIISLTEEEALAQGYTIRGYDPATKTFNNKVAMNWSDVVALAQLLMDTGASDFGFYTEWWFNYGWSVGGDCIEYLETDNPAYNGGYYKFTLNDKTKNYIVKD
ncbi:MAG: extracellular solute-binding protein, partial [Clostridia bacterium]|nr:extracellular solute-binding protein [Clostridia bacterium]